MARYIKANPKVAAYLNLQNDRNTVKDGNYILWQSDLLPFGPLHALAKRWRLSVLSHLCRTKHARSRTAYSCAPCLLQPTQGLKFLYRYRLKHPNPKHRLNLSRVPTIPSNPTTTPERLKTLPKRKTPTSRKPQRQNNKAI